MSRITSGEAPTGVEDDLPDAALFVIETAPRWAEPILDILSFEVSWEGQNKEETIARLEQAENYSLVSGRLYR